MEEYIGEERYAWISGGRVIAEIDFPYSGNHEMTITRTFVDDSLRGQGAAKKLVMKAMKLAKEKGCHLRATCEYAQSYFEKNPDPIYLKD